MLYEVITDIVYLAGGWGAAFDFGQSETLGHKISEAFAAGRIVGRITSYNVCYTKLLRMTCQPMGIPRQGAPGRIFQTENDITLLYGRGGDGGGGYPDFRVIATDGRPFDERQIIQTKYTGHSVGHWQGDTLVIESIGFTPATWLARGGFFHSEDMKVIEKFTRKGDQLLYEVTVEDPEVLLQPWVQTPVLLTTGGEDDDSDRAALIGVERGHCQSLELDDITWQIRH